MYLLVARMFNKLRQSALYIATTKRTLYTVGFFRCFAFETETRTIELNTNMTPFSTSKLHGAV